MLTVVEPFDMQTALGHPQWCGEEVRRRGHLDACNATAVALRVDPEHETPYPVCARHARGEMVPLEAIVRFMLDRYEAQRLVASGLVAMATTSGKGPAE